MPTLKRPLLAAKTTDEDLKRLPYPMLLSPKIDGIRALVVGGQLVSRTLKKIPNLHTQKLFSLETFEGLDGELVVGAPYDPNLMQQTSSGVMSVHGQPDVSYHVFDTWDVNADFAYRTSRAHDLATFAKRNFNIPIYYVAHSVVNSYEELLDAEDHYIQVGYEGVMLRRLDGPYKQNRSTLREGILLKVKRFEDGEAVVIAYEPLRRNLNSQTRDERGYAKRSHHQDNKVADTLLGSLCVRDLKTDVSFSIGSGFTEAQRQSLWDMGNNLIGKIVKYKSQPCGVKDKPRLPIFLGFRDPIDM
jgi:DNA ligase-1